MLTETTPTAKRTRKRKREKASPLDMADVENSKVLLLREDVDPRANAHATPRLFDMLPKQWPNGYAKIRSFPFHRIVTEKL